MTDRCGLTPDVVHAGLADHREGRRSSRPGLGSTIRSLKGSRCTTQHFVLCGTYILFTWE